jgi:hypothetical protein
MTLIQGLIGAAELHRTTAVLRGQIRYEVRLQFSDWYSHDSFLPVRFINGLGFQGLAAFRLFFA